MLRVTDNKQQVIARFLNLLQDRSTTSEQLSAFLDQHQKYRLPQIKLNPYQMNALHICAQHRTFHLMPILCLFGAKAYAVDSYRYTPLDYLLTWVPLWSNSHVLRRVTPQEQNDLFTQAIYAGTMLIKNGCDPNTTHCGQTLLNLACLAKISPNDKLVYIANLLSLGSDPNVGFAPLKWIINHIYRVHQYDDRDLLLKDLALLYDIAVMLIEHNADSEAIGYCRETILETAILHTRSKMRSKYVSALLAQGCSLPENLFVSLFSKDSMTDPTIDIMPHNDIETMLAICAKNTAYFIPGLMRKLSFSIFMLYPQIQGYLVQHENLKQYDLNSPSWLEKVNIADLKLMLRQYAQEKNNVNFFICIWMQIISDRCNKHSLSAFRKVPYDLLFLILGSIDADFLSVKYRRMSEAITSSYNAIRKQAQTPGGIGILAKTDKTGQFHLGFFKSAEAVAREYKCAPDAKRKKIKSDYALPCWKSQLSITNNLADQLALQERVQKTDLYKDFKSELELKKVTL